MLRSATGRRLPRPGRLNLGSNPGNFRNPRPSCPAKRWQVFSQGNQRRPLRRARRRPPVQYRAGREVYAGGVRLFARVMIQREELFASRSFRRSQLRSFLNQNRRTRKSKIPRNVVNYVDLANVKTRLESLQRQINLENNGATIRSRNFIRQNWLRLINFCAALQKLDA